MRLSEVTYLSVSLSAYRSPLHKCTSLSSIVGLPHPAFASHLSSLKINLLILKTLFKHL